jgi:hypothetical protein
VGWLVSEMYFFEGGICITTLAHRADASPPPPLLIRSRAHLFTCYLDVEAYPLDVETHYLDAKSYTLASSVCLLLAGVTHLVNIPPTFSNMLTNIIPRYTHVSTYHDMMIHCIGVAYFAPLQSKRRHSVGRWSGRFG